MPETPPAREPADAPSNQVSLPRWDELKREYNLRHKALLRHPAPSAPSGKPADAQEETPR